MLLLFFKSNMLSYFLATYIHNFDSIQKNRGGIKTLVSKTKFVDDIYPPYSQSVPNKCDHKLIDLPPLQNLKVYQCTHGLPLNGIQSVLL